MTRQRRHDTEGEDSPRVLIVEDDQDVREVLRRFLRAEGMDVTVAAGAEEAKAFAAAQPFDVLVVDMVMPGQQGPELVAQLRRTGNTSRVILVTGYAIDFDNPAVAAMGADRILTKPYPLPKLAEEIRTLAARATEERRTLNGSGRNGA